MAPAKEYQNVNKKAMLSQENCAMPELFQFKDRWHSPQAEDTGIGKTDGSFHNNLENLLEYRHRPYTVRN